jgi:hypothetical protein
MRITATEPSFSLATAKLGDEIRRQLVLASRRSRPRWKEIFEGHRPLISMLRGMIEQGHHTVQFPLVAGFMNEWAQNFDWPVCPSGCSDAIGIDAPERVLSEVMRFGNVESFEVMLGDLHSPCCAFLGNNDHDLRFGIIVNCPVWIELASHEEHTASFEKQLGMVIHHEMAHFLHQKDGAVSEMHGHARGVAWVLASSKEPPQSADEAMTILANEHFDVWHNPEVRALFVDRGQAGWRLVRLWMNHLKAAGVSSNC